MSITGTYKYINGKVIKVSSCPPSSTAKDRWFAKYKLDGNKEMAKCYKNFEAQGKLNKVDDKEVWKDLKQYL